MPFQPRVTPVEQLVFRSELVWIGRFRCPRQHPLFRDSGPASAHLLVFPRTAVRIVRRGRAPFSASANVAVFYNPGDEYRREAVSPEGDHCDWFAVEPGLAEQAAQDLTPAGAGEAFRFAHGPSDAASYLEQRLVLHAAASPGADRLRIEEAVIGLLGRLLGAARGAPAGNPAPAPGGLRPGERDVVEAAREFLTGHLGAAVSLAEVARAVGCPVFRLCRIFRRGAGRSLHAYRNQLRLRQALDRMAERQGHLSGLAQELGFSSHSHFTQAFRAAFGLTPTAFQGRVGAGRRPLRPQA